MAATAPDRAPDGEGVVVLTRDEALIHTLRSIGSEYNIFTASTESELASQHKPPTQTRKTLLA